MTPAVTPVCYTLGQANERTPPMTSLTFHATDDNGRSWHTVTFTGDTLPEWLTDMLADNLPTSLSATVRLGSITTTNPDGTVTDRTL